MPTLDPSLLKSLYARIYEGATAEDSLRRKLTEWAQKQIPEKIPRHEAEKLAKQALTATINSVRHNRTWKPGLVEQMVQDQVYVYYCQHRTLTKNQTDQFRTFAANYIRKRMRCWNSGAGASSALTPEQEDVCDAAINVFIDTLLDPTFVLTSSLTTFLIGIVKNKGYEAARQRKKPTSGSPPIVYIPPLPAEMVSFYEALHNRMAKAFGEISEKCQTILIDYYNLDSQKITVKAIPDEPLLPDEFDRLFSVALQQPGPGESLLAIADRLRISHKKISTRHIDCLTQIVQQVIPELMGDDRLTVPASIRILLKKRLDKAHRQTKK
jgi:hypothetical protein